MVKYVNKKGRQVISLRLFQTSPRFRPRPPHYSLLINDRVYKSIKTLEIHLDWSGMVYSRVGSSDLLLILGCKTSNSFFFSNLSFFTSPSSFSWRADNTVFANKPPQMCFQINIPSLGPPLKVFLTFFLEDITSAPDVFTSCSFISRAHFETRLVMVSCYGYKIWRHK